MSYSRRLDDYIKPGRQGRAVQSRPIHGPATTYSDIAKRLEHIEARLEALEESLKEVLEALRRLESKLDRLEKGGRALGEHRLRSLIEKEGFLLISEARQKLGISPSRLLSLARDLGLVVLDLDGDAAVMSENAYMEFKSKLASIKTSDPEEAASLMGRFAKVFALLRRKGDIYYDSKSRSWKMLSGT